MGRASGFEAGWAHGQIWFWSRPGTQKVAYGQLLEQSARPPTSSPCLPLRVALGGSSLDLLINGASTGINAALRPHLLCDPSDARRPSGESQRDFAGTSDPPTLG